MKTADVLATVRELETLLRQHKVKYLALVEQKRHRLETIDGRVLPARVRGDLLEVFGGMGSLNDVVISRVNGHDVEDEDKANQELDRLSSQLWSLLSGPES